MLYLFLDESGDLGFDFVQKKPSEHFVVTILAIKGDNNRKKLAKAVFRTLHKKLDPKNRAKASQELKGMDTSLQIKRYFMKQAELVDFSLYTVILPKRKLFSCLSKNKAKIYDFATQVLLKSIPLEEAKQKVVLILDRSKNKHSVKEFNEYTFTNLKSRLNRRISIIIHHYDSQAVGELQAVDLFAWGIFRKYEKNDMEWYKLYKDRIQLEHVLKP